MQVFQIKDTSNNNNKRNNNSGYNIIKVNLESQTKTIYDRKSELKRSDKSKDNMVEEELENRIPSKPMDTHVRQISLRNRRRVDYNKLANPKANKLI